VSQRAHIESELAIVDHNVRIATDLDTIRHAAPRREVILESYEICDKLAFIQPLSDQLRRIYAYACLYVAFYQEEESGNLDLKLLRKSEQLWEDIRHVRPDDMEARGFLVIVRSKLADLLTAAGEQQEASRYRAQALLTARGDGGLLFEIALEYARRIGPVDRLPSGLDGQRRAAIRATVVDDTMAMLREAVRAGFADRARFREELPLEPIRETSAFQALLQDVAFPAEPFASKQLVRH
jgi:hypothetical protein